MRINTLGRASAARAKTMNTSALVVRLVDQCPREMLIDPQREALAEPQKSVCAVRIRE
jgi:hypothetical protein